MACSNSTLCVGNERRAESGNFFDITDFALLHFGGQLAEDERSATSVIRFCEQLGDEDIRHLFSSILVSISTAEKFIFLDLPIPLAFADTLSRRERIIISCTLTLVS